MQLQLMSLFVAGALAFTGWTIPEDQPNGVYSVSIDASGNATHTLIGPPAPQANAARADTALPARAAKPAAYARKRRCTGTCIEYGCAGYGLDPTDTNNAAWALDAQCSAPHGNYVEPGKDFYSIAGGTVWYYCNLASGQAYCAKSDRALYADNIAHQCGSFNAGWVIINSPFASPRQVKVSYGQERSDAKFCGRGINGR